jgi:hypothetical protein
MESICVEGGGSFGFIPDCSMVGTVFINWCAKALLTVAHNVRVKVGSNIFFLGDCLKGQSKSLYFPQWLADTIVSEVQYDNGLVYTPTPFEKTGSVLSAKSIAGLYESVKALTKIKFIHNVVKLSSEAQSNGVANDPISILNMLYSELSNLHSQDALIQDILLDIVSSNENEGQIQKAISKQEWWDTWGANHCIAYARALRLQQCINFKDRVLQHFVSDEFKELQEKGADIFSTLEVPTPSGYGGGDLTFSSGHIDMSRYISQAGPCFAGDCFVLMHGNTYCKVRNLRKGDRVYGGHAVACILFTPAHSMKVEMVHFESGLQITPWHPIHQEGLPWMFPAEHPAGKLVQSYIDGYYNLVLESGHVIEMHGYKVCTLGHGFTDNEVIVHPYFGTNAVVEDLKTYNGWEYGFIKMNPLRLRRDSETGLVNRI